MKSFSFLLFLFTFTLSHAEDIRFCSIGMGGFGTSTAKLAIEKGFKMVAAFTRYSKHTKTVGQLLGMEDDPSLQFEVSGMRKLEEIIDATKPHFCIDATNSTLGDVFPHFRRLLAKGINILTLSNEAIFPNTRFHWKPKQLYRALDKFAKESNAVVLGGGFSDSLLMPVIPSMAASMMELNRIRITVKINADGAAEKDARFYGVGMTEKDFNGYRETLINIGISYWQRAVVEALADSLDLSLLDVTSGAQKESIALYTRMECYKVANENGLQSNALNQVIDSGDCAGINVTVLGRAKDNVEIVLSVVFAVLPEVESSNMEVVLSGVPDLEFLIKNIDMHVVTGASLLHRVPMVLNELQPGFHDVNKLGANRYWSKVDDWNVQEIAEVVSNEKEGEGEGETSGEADDAESGETGDVKNDL
eukprot:UN01029